MNNEPTHSFVPGYKNDHWRTNVILLDKNIKTEKQLTIIILDDGFFFCDKTKTYSFIRLQLDYAGSSFPFSAKGPYIHLPELKYFRLYEVHF